MRKLATAVLAVTLIFGMSGCNAYQRAEAVEKIVASVLAIASVEVPQFPANEQPIISGFITAGTSLNAAYGTCIDNANSTMLNKSGKFLDCLGIFSKALNDPQLLAQLRILSPTSAKRVQLWLTAVSVGVNEALIWFGAQAPPPPTMGPLPTVAELHDFRAQVVRGL